MDLMTTYIPNIPQSAFLTLKFLLKGNVQLGIHRYLSHALPAHKFLNLFLFFLIFHSLVTLYSNPFSTGVRIIFFKCKFIIICPYLFKSFQELSITFWIQICLSLQTWLTVLFTSQNWLRVFQHVRQLLAFTLLFKLLSMFEMTFLFCLLSKLLFNIQTVKISSVMSVTISSKKSALPASSTKQG